MSPSLTPISSLESSKDFAALAKRWYELLNALAPDYMDISEDDEPSPPWEDLPENDRKLLTQVFINMIGEGTIR